MPEEAVVQVGMAEFMVAVPPAKLGCFGVGSCICIALYDPLAKIAGLAHVMLPSDQTSADLGRSVTSAVPALIAALEQAGAKKERLFARLVGGATMFTFAGKQEGPAPLGERNTITARATLTELGVEIRAEDCGGALGRSLELDPVDGTLAVWSAFQYIRWI